MIQITKIKSSNIQQATNTLKQRYPYSKIIAYKFKEDYRMYRPKEYKKRYMNIAYIKDIREIKESL